MAQNDMMMLYTAASFSHVSIVTSGNLRVINSRIGYLVPSSGHLPSSRSGSTMNLGVSSPDDSLTPSVEPSESLEDLLISATTQVFGKKMISQNTRIKQEHGSGLRVRVVASYSAVPNYIFVI